MKLKNTSQLFRPATFLACAAIAALTMTQSVSAQCCGGNSAGYPSEMGYPGMVMGLPGDYIPGQIIEGDSIYITLMVPEKAIVQINGDPTISLGPTRYFVVRGLTLDKTYTFEVVVETANPAGVAMEEKKKLELKPGASEIITMKPVKRKVPKPAAVADAKGTDSKADALAGADKPAA